MFDFAGADTESKGSKGSMCRSMTVTTDYSGPRKGEALLWTYDMDNALALVAQAEVGETEGLNVGLQGEALCTRVGLFNELSHVLEVVAGCSGNILYAVIMMVAETNPDVFTWSVVARVQSGLRTFRLAFLNPSKACFWLDQSPLGSMSLLYSLVR